MCVYFSIYESTKEKLTKTVGSKWKNDYARLAEIYKTDILYISLYTNKYTIAYNTELVGEMNSNWFNPFTGIETWYK